MSQEDKNNPSQSSPEKKRKFSRRKFFQRAGIVLGTTVVGIYFGRDFIRTKIAEYGSEMDLPLGIFNMDPDFWFEVLEDNKVLLKLAKMEMGQGIFTGAAMIAAEELGVPMEQITVQPASTKTGPRDMAGTGGSSSTSALYLPLREVAATMREMLKTAAAKKWEVDINTISVENGIMSSGSNTISYAEISKEKTDWKVPRTPPLKPAADFQYIGKEIKRVDLVPKVMGDSIFGIDKELPDMLYATVLHPPFLGATLKSIDTGEAENHEGVVKVVKQDNWIAVIANKRFTSVMASKKLRPEWDVPKVWEQSDIEDAIKPENGVSYIQVQHEGNTDILSDKQANIFEQTYHTPIGVHAQLEPNGTIAHVQEDQVLVITGTQFSDAVQEEVANAIGISKDKVNVQTCFLGGGFGGRYFQSTGATAAILSKIVGKPVHLLRTREEEFQNRYFRPPSHHVLSAKIEEDGTIRAIKHVMSSADMAIRAFAGELALKILGGDFASTGHGARFIYNFKNKCAKVINCNVPFPTGIWRGVGQFPNCFAIECFIDELAIKTGKDPIQFRLDHLTDSKDPIILRCRKVLEVLEEQSGWKTPKPVGTGRGIAFCEDRKSIAAAMIEVQQINGIIKVSRVVQVLDPGRIINPEGVRMQVEGATIMGISAGLYEATYLENGQFTATNYHEYPMALLKDTPEIEVILLEGSDTPYGVGEPPIAPVAPALANAIFDLTGERIRTLPLVKN